MDIYIYMTEVCRARNYLCRSGQGDKTAAVAAVLQDQDLTLSSSSSPAGHSVISATVICHWSFPAERHQSSSLTLCAACHPSTRSF